MGCPKVDRGATRANNVVLVAETEPFGVAAVLIQRPLPRLLHLLSHRPLPLLPLPYLERRRRPVTGTAVAVLVAGAFVFVLSPLSILNIRTHFATCFSYPQRISFWRPWLRDSLLLEWSL